MSKRSDQVNLELLKFPAERRQMIVDMAYIIAERDGRDRLSVKDIRAAAALAGPEFLGGEPVE